MTFSDFNSATIDEFHAKKGKGVGPFGDRLLLVTHTGAKSGALRTSPLAYTRDGDRYVIVASKGGAPTNPSWYHNLVAHPEVTLEVGAEKFRARAHVVKGAERDRLFEQHASVLPVFRGYVKKTTRVLPVLALERID
jgi:deazaflavin-dependent oxidoreductase (nitroreductase family)